jgi:hypothetical protein
MHPHTNGAAHHNISENIVDKLVATGLIAEQDRSDPAALDAALDRLLMQFAATPPGRPNANFFITPQTETGANTQLMLGLIDLLVALNVLPKKAIEALLVYARAAGRAAYAPAGQDQLISHYGDVLAWALRRHGVELDAKAIAQAGLR